MFLSFVAGLSFNSAAAVVERRQNFARTALEKRKREWEEAAEAIKKKEKERKNSNNAAKQGTKPFVTS